MSPVKIYSRKCKGMLPKYGNFNKKVLVRRQDYVNYAMMYVLPDVSLFCRQTEGYSGSDLTALARDAALGPIRGKLLWIYN